MGISIEYILAVVLKVMFKDGGKSVLIELGAVSFKSKSMTQSAPVKVSVLKGKSQHQKIGVRDVKMNM